MTHLIKTFLKIRRPIIVLLHAVLILAANAAAFSLRFDGDVPAEFIELQLAFLPWLIAIRLATFIPFRLFEGLWKYTGLWDLRNIFLGVAISSIVFYAVVVSTNATALQYPRSIYLIDAVLLICLMTGIRLGRRIYTEILRPKQGRRVLIYGAGDAGVLILRDMRQNDRFNATPIGFVDDDSQKIGRWIQGVPVLGGRAQLPQILKAHAPEELLIALPSASRDTLRSIVRILEPYKIRITTLPKLHELLGERVDVGQIRQLKVEDLLARDPVGIDYQPVRKFLEGRRVLVTGAGGSIGSELCRQIAHARPASLLLLDRYENSLFQIHNELTTSFPELCIRPIIADVTDSRRVDQIFSDVHPQVVFHAAAHKHVPLMEGNPCEAVKNNVRGTRLIAEASVRHGSERFVLISTDKAVNPTSVMGSTKRVAELVVDELGRNQSTRCVAVRFGNVLGSNGSVVPTFLAQIEKGGPVTVTHPEMRRFFMLIPEAVQLVLHAGALPDRATLFVLEMGDQLRIVDVARDLIRLSGLVPDKDIQVEFTGVRPGEKLFEELVGEGEVAAPSSLSKILCVQSTYSRRYDGLLESVARLEALALDERPDDVVRQLTKLLSEFSPTRTESSPV